MRALGPELRQRNTPRVTTRIAAAFAGLGLLLSTGCARPAEPQTQEPVAESPAHSDATQCQENDGGIRVCPCETGSALYPSCGDPFIDACTELGADAFECTQTCDDGTCCEGTCIPPS